MCARLRWRLLKTAGLPFSDYIAKVDAKRGVPVRATVVTTVFLGLLGLLNIASTAAFTAILSLAVVGIYISYLLPVILMLYVRLRQPNKLQYGPWKLGRWGVPLNVVAILYTLFTSVIMLFPPYQPVTALNMNYASAILAGVLVLSGCFWMIKARKNYSGPTHGAGMNPTREGGVVKE